MHYGWLNTGLAYKFSTKRTIVYSAIEILDVMILIKFMFFLLWKKKLFVLHKKNGSDINYCALCLIFKLDKINCILSMLSARLLWRSVLF